MVDILDRLKRKKKKAEIIDKRKKQLLADGGTVLEICKNCVTGYNGILYVELKQKCGSRWGNTQDIDGRILKAVTFLKDNGMVGFGGKLGDLTVSFDRMNMPSLGKVINFGELK